MNNTSLNVLVVDDDRIVCKAHQHFLMQLGCHVTTAENGEQALKQLDQPYQLVLMDIDMPVLNGIEATRTIREKAGLNQCVPIVAVTNHIDKKTEKACLQAGINEMAAKPLLPSVLERLLKKWAPTH